MTLIHLYDLTVDNKSFSLSKSFTLILLLTQFPSIGIQIDMMFRTSVTAPRLTASGTGSCLAGRTGGTGSGTRSVTIGTLGADLARVGRGFPVVSRMTN